MSDKVRMLVELTPYWMQRLDKEKGRTGAAKAEIIRAALKDYFAKLDAEIVTKAEAEKVMSRDY